MTPDPGKVLPAIAAALGTQVLPEVRTPFAGQTAGMAVTILMLMAQDFDRSASSLVEENIAVREILRSGASLVSDQSLRDRIAALDAVAVNRDLRISALTAENSGLRQLLIELHAAVEDTPGPEAKAMDETIWQELRRSTARRHLEGLLG